MLFSLWFASAEEQAQNMRIRKCRPSDVDGIRTLVTAVVSEIYGPILPAGIAVDGDTDWEPGWVADSAGNLVAVMLTEKDWLEDLWIAKGHRGRHLGARLLAIAEQEIAARGFARARLRVVAENTAARDFYARHGWREGRRYPHERLGFDMVDMSKKLRSG
jgi:GNAT superfamily N-acetyltransferase